MSYTVFSFPVAFTGLVKPLFKSRISNLTRPCQLKPRCNMFIGGVMRNRTSLLFELIHNPLPDSDIIQELAEYPMTCDHPLATVSSADFLEILRQFEDGNLNASQLEEWAVRIEARRDIGFEFGAEGVVEEALFCIAHRDIYGSIDSEQCRRIKSMFERRCEDRVLH
jgi:hypothetical protein